MFSILHQKNTEAHLPVQPFMWLWWYVIWALYTTKEIVIHDFSSPLFFFFFGGEFYTLICGAEMWGANVAIG